MGKVQLFIERTAWANYSRLLRELYGEITVVYRENCMQHTNTIARGKCKVP